MIEQLLQQLQGMQLDFRDIIDILLVAFVLYQFVQILQGTLGAKMALGLGVVMLVSYISDSAQLSTMHWIFGNFWQIWVIAIIILFQPEFRQALARVGQQSGFLSRPQMSSASAEQTVEELVKAVTALSGSKTGALIVLEREMGLRAFSEMGVTLDANVTSELLRCLFFMENPLHDGAVIIAEDRIVAAACFLPLTKNPLIPSTMGSRHRAAMGITEETDAVSIVVSEETGTISVVVGGKMTRELLAPHLKQVLETVYGLPARTSGPHDEPPRPFQPPKYDSKLDKTRPIPRIRT